MFVSILLGRQERLFGAGAGAGDDEGRLVGRMGSDGWRRVVERVGPQASAARRRRRRLQSAQRGQPLRRERERSGTADSAPDSDSAHCRVSLQQKQYKQHPARIPHPRQAHFRSDGV